MMHPVGSLLIRVLVCTVHLDNDLSALIDREPSLKYHVHSLESSYEFPSSAVNSKLDKASLAEEGPALNSHISFFTEVIPPLVTLSKKGKV